MPYEEGQAATGSSAETRAIASSPMPATTAWTAAVSIVASAAQGTTPSSLRVGASNTRMRFLLPPVALRPAFSSYRASEVGTPPPRGKAL